MEGFMIILLVLLVVAYWLTPLILLILGLTKLKTKPKDAKQLLIAAATMVVIGLGFCSAMLY